MTTHRGGGGLDQGSRRAIKTLVLMRHAKAGWDDEAQEDIDRPLTPRGRDEAVHMGNWLAGQAFAPDLLLASSARRARETAELVGPRLAPPPGQRLDQALYMASPGTILAALQGLPDDLARVLVIGHNPGLHGLALLLTGTGARPERLRLQSRFPPAAVAMFRFESRHWRELAPGAGFLVHYAEPRDVA